MEAVVLRDLSKIYPGGKKAVNLSLIHIYEGANVRQMEAKGIRTEKGELNRWIKATNRLMQDVSCLLYTSRCV